HLDTAFTDEVHAAGRIALVEDDLAALEAAHHGSGHERGALTDREPAQQAAWTWGRGARGAEETRPMIRAPFHERPGPRQPGAHSRAEHRRVERPGKDVGDAVHEPPGRAGPLGGRKEQDRERRAPRFSAYGGRALQQRRLASRADQDPEVDRPARTRGPP